MKIGVLFMNTGTVDEPTLPAVSDYLREFLMDPAIIGAPRFIRKRIVNHIVRSRPQHTVQKYRRFWTPEGSPFMLTSQLQAQLLEASLRERLGEEVDVALAMRYGNPSIADGLGRLCDSGCDTVVLFPAYPQMVKVCAGTCLRKAGEVLSELRTQRGWNPSIQEVTCFYQLPSYRQALAESVASHWRYAPGSKLLVSYHSTLLADIKAGDPYESQARETAHNLAIDLGIPADDVVICYQSRFDNRKWLQPFTESIVFGMARQGVKDLAIVCPIFVADNMETVLDIGRELRDGYLRAAGENARFTYIPALNGSAGFIEACADAVCMALESTD